MDRITDAEYNWGKTHPVDFWDAGEAGEIREVTNRKWWPWTAANDLAAKECMVSGDYLVRCTICKDEKFQPSGVFICPKEECKQAIAILLELGYTDDWPEVADEWYASWYSDTPVAKEAKLGEAMHREANRAVCQTLAEPTTEGA